MEMNSQEYKGELRRLYREQQGWMADSLEELYEQFARDKYLAKQVTLEDETKEKDWVSNCLNGNLMEVLRLITRSFPFNWAGLIILFIALFFAIIKPAPFAMVTAPASTNLGTSIETSEMITSPGVFTSQRSSKFTAISEREEVMGILELIRSAQLKKDINMLLNAYSPSFPDIEKKKENILKTWQQYNYLDMHYYIDNFQKINDHSIIARVTWEITFVDIRSNKKRNLLKYYTINFSDVTGKLLIQELTQGIKSRKAASVI